MSNNSQASTQVKNNALELKSEVLDNFSESAVKNNYDKLFSTLRK